MARKLDPTPNGNQRPRDDARSEPYRPDLYAGPDDRRWRAVELLADAWGYALESSYRLGRADGYTEGYWDAEHEMAHAWALTAAAVRETMSQPTFAELKRRRGEAS
jgi:hypothetical protein